MGDAPREALAKRLFAKMERLDPPPLIDPDELGNWDRLTDRQKDFYRLCIKEVFCDAALAAAAMG